MVVFDQECYTGIDQYSDGDIENTILSIVEKGQNWKEMKDIPYPVLYHLSEERENILSWYPFRENCRILEVGSGCGAITGLLCRRGKEVVSVELSKRRGWINYTRNKSCENLTIRIGNLNDMHFDEPFDYVVLNGVFEYAASFTDGEHPYETFLNHIKSYCKRDGHILVAIENRLGLKYFSGAAEDHTNVHFLGLNEYEGNNTVRTFSRSEMKEIAARCGIAYADFYYPYPDYKFPAEIYTDATINEKGYGRPYANLSGDRCFVFNEFKMAKTLREEHVMGSFANSFLVDFYQDEQHEDRVIYAKMCSGRNKPFQIQTCIYRSEAGEQYVEKQPLNASVFPHMEHLKNAEKVFSKGGCEILESVWHGENLKYPYLKRETVQQKLQNCLNHMDQKALCQEMECVFDRCIPHGKRCNYQTEDFLKMFGAVAGAMDEECISPVNLDLTFDNMFPSENGYTVIDPEWWIEFPVPRKFLLWRTLNEFYSGQPAAEKVWPKNECMQHFEISEQQQECYYHWATHFVEHYVGQSVAEKCAKPVHSVHLDQWLQKMRICSSLYLDNGYGFSEEQKIAVETYCDEGRFELRFDLSQYPEIKSLRWDPVENSGIRCTIDCIQIEESGATCFATPINGIRENTGDVFYTLDPQYLIQKEEAGGWNGVLFIAGELQYLDPGQVFTWNWKILHTALEEKQIAKEQLAAELDQAQKRFAAELAQAQKQLEDTSLQLNEKQVTLEKTQAELTEKVFELEQIKSTKWWKLYSRMKGIKK